MNRIPSRRAPSSVVYEELKRVLDPLAKVATASWIEETQTAFNEVFEAMAVFDPDWSDDFTAHQARVRQGFRPPIPGPQMVHTLRHDERVSWVVRNRLNRAFDKISSALQTPTARTPAIRQSINDLNCFLCQVCHLFFLHFMANQEPDQKPEESLSSPRLELAECARVIDLPLPTVDRPCLPPPKPQSGPVPPPPPVEAYLTPKGQPENCRVLKFDPTRRRRPARR